MKILFIVLTLIRLLATGIRKALQEEKAERKKLEERVERLERAVFKNTNYRGQN